MLRGTCRQVTLQRPHCYYKRRVRQKPRHLQPLPPPAPHLTTPPLARCDAPTQRMMPDDPEGLEDFEAPFPNKLDCEDGAFVANLLNSGRLSARRPDEFVIIAAHE